MEVVRTMVLPQDYVHGYQPTEGHRLQDQARTLADLLHHDTWFPDGSTVLELGCGVGAQSVELLRRNPGIRLTCVDRSAESLQIAEARLRESGVPTVHLHQADWFDLPQDDGPLRAGSFDHVVVCFVLEHLSAPEDALARARQLLRPGGSVSVIEGDHGSTTFHPDSRAAHQAISCQVALQRSAGPCSPEPGSPTSMSPPARCTSTAAVPAWPTASSERPSPPWSPGSVPPPWPRGSPHRRPSTRASPTCSAPPNPTASSATRSTRPSPPHPDQAGVNVEELEARDDDAPVPQQAPGRRRRPFGQPATVTSTVSVTPLTVTDTCATPGRSAVTRPVRGS